MSVASSCQTLFRSFPSCQTSSPPARRAEADVRAARRGGRVAERITLACEGRLPSTARRGGERAVRLDDTTVGGLDDAFRERYAALYGAARLAHAAGDLVTVAIASGAVPRPVETPVTLGSADSAPARRGARAAWMPGTSGRAQVAVYDGERLAPGMALAGPAVIDRRDTTIVVQAGDRASVDAAGSLVIEVGSAAG